MIDIKHIVINVHNEQTTKACTIFIILADVACMLLLMALVPLIQQRSFLQWVFFAGFIAIGLVMIEKYIPSDFELKADLLEDKVFLQWKNRMVVFRYDEIVEVVRVTSVGQHVEEGHHRIRIHTKKGSLSFYTNEMGKRWRLYLKRQSWLNCMKHFDRQALLAVKKM